MQMRKSQKSILHVRTVGLDSPKR